MFKISKVRYRSSEKNYNCFNIYTPFLSYIVKRPISEGLLKSMDKIMACKSLEEIIQIGGEEAPKTGKISLDQYFVGKGLSV
jgi:hypothetical protein